MSNPNQLLEARITKAKEDIKLLGLDVPERAEELTDEGYLEQLKAFYKENKSAPKKTKQEAEKADALAGQPDGTTHFTAEQVEQMLSKMQSSFEERLKKEREERQKDNEKLDKVLQQLQMSNPSTEKGNLMQDPQFLAAMDQIIHGRERKDGLIDSRYVNEADRIKPTTFWATKKFGKLSFRIEGGVRIAPPNGSDGVKFFYNFRNVDPQTLRITTRGYFVTESRLMAEWLRKHEKFGVEIFENIEEADKQNSNSDWADARDRYLQILNQQTDDRIINTALQLGVRFNQKTSITEIKRLVAERQANKEFQEQASARNEFMQRKSADALLFEKVTGGKAVAAPTT